MYKKVFIVSGLVTLASIGWGVKKMVGDRPPIQKQLPSLLDKIDILDYSFSDSKYYVGKPFFVNVSLSEWKLRRAEKMGKVSRSPYYAVRIFANQAETRLVNNSTEIQHKPPVGFESTWSYEIKPTSRGEMNLIFSLVMYEKGDRHAGANIASDIQPIYASMRSMSSWSFMVWKFSSVGGWGILSSIVSAVAGWKLWKKRGSRT